MTVDETRRYKPGANKRPRGDIAAAGRHRGRGQDALWLAAVDRIDAARLSEGLEDEPAVMARVAPTGQDAHRAPLSADHRND
jgi:hypothetical protein